MRKPDNLPMTFTKNDVEIIARETLYRGFFSLDLYRFRHRLFRMPIMRRRRQYHTAKNLTPRTCSCETNNHHSATACIR